MWDNDVVIHVIHTERPHAIIKEVYMFLRVDVERIVCSNSFDTSLMLRDILSSVWLSHGLLVLVPGEDLTGLESPLGQEDGDLLLRIRWWHLPPQQLERNFILRPPRGTNEDNAVQVLAKYRGEEVLAVPRVSWHNCQIRRINLKSNSISKNNI